MSFPIKSRGEGQVFPKLKMKKTTEQRWCVCEGVCVCGWVLNTLHADKLFGEKSGKKDSIQQDTVPRLEMGKEFSQCPSSAFLLKPCLVFSLSGWLAAMPYDSGFKSTWKEQPNSVYLLCDKRYCLDIITKLWVLPVCPQSTAEAKG